MRDDLFRIFAPAFGWSGRGESGPGRFTPSVDVTETATHVIVSAEVPGVDAKDLDVVLTEDTLTIRGQVAEKAEAAEGGYRRIERRYGAFERTIPLPAAVQHQQARAEYKNGILEVTAPKLGPDQTKATRLVVNGESGSERTSLPQ